MNLNYPYSNLQNSFPQMQMGQNQIPFKPIAFERVSDIIGIAYNLAAMDNVSVLPAPRQNEQQIFFINGDDKIYSRTADAGIGIVGYKQEYVQNLENELAEAQAQLSEIFNTIIADPEPEPGNHETHPDLSSFDERLNRLENMIIKLVEEQTNESNGSSKNVGTVSELAQTERNNNGQHSRKDARSFD